MTNRKGFSLIELMAVIVIIGLILVVVLPAVSRLLTNNDKKQYNSYLTIIEAGAIRYADSRKDDLGGYKDNGCIEVSLNELINNDYIKEYNDNKVTCSGKVRLNNKSGNLEVYINLTCTSKSNGKITFEKKKIDNTSCEAYTME